MATTKYPHPSVYAWECDFGLCRWAEPSKDRLIANTKPSPEAKARLVRLVPEMEYRRLMKRARHAR